MDSKKMGNKVFFLNNIFKLILIKLYSSQNVLIFLILSHFFCFCFNLCGDIYNNIKHYGKRLKIANFKKTNNLS